MKIDNLGTDHGTANDMYLIGPKVSGGSWLPSEIGSTKPRWKYEFTTDFRRVYSTLIRDWLKLKPERILSGGLDPIEAIISANWLEFASTLRPLTFKLTNY